MFAKILNEKTKEVQVGLGDDYKFYSEVGMEEMEVEQAYNNRWYVKGYVPTEPIEEKEKKVRFVRNSYLEETDKFVTIPDFPINNETKKLYIEYRQYLRDYPKTKDWFEQNPKTFEEYK